MKGSFHSVAIFATILVVAGIEAVQLRELPTKFEYNYQPYVCEEYSMRPHDSKCNLYTKCINNQLVLKECESGLHWDRLKKVCTSPEKAKCLNYHPKVCNEGTYKPDDKNCDKYYKCINNELVQKKCSKGYYWNRLSNICTDPEEADCSIAPLVCEEGSFKPHFSKCNLYYKCINNQLVLKECESGLHWARSKKVCTSPEKAKCPNYHPKVCNEGTYKPDEKNCDKYYKCISNEFVQKKCSKGYYWNRLGNICTDLEEADCPIAPFVCEEGSVKPHDSKCNLYTKCINNQLVLKKCKSGLHWDRVRNLCTYPTSAKCFNYHPKVCNEGTYKPDDKNCDKYYKCINNEFVQKKCSKGYYWNRLSNICTDPEEADCSIAPPVCEEGSFKPHDSKCNLYYKCINNQLVLKECKSGLHWDRLNKFCASPEKAKCPNYHPKVCNEGTYKPDDKNCDKYYKCINNEFVQKKCSKGYYWNRLSNICTDPEEADCSIAPPVCEEGSFKPHDSKCNLYYKCINNQLVLKECKSGLHWDRLNKFCASPEKAKCPNYHPKVCNEGTYKPDEKNCDKYYKCINNEFVQKKCSKGYYWNRLSNICTDPEEADCSIAPPVCEEGSFKPHDSKCNLYYKCINNQLVLKVCESGLHWARSKKVCTSPEKAKCPNYHPKGCDEGTYKPDDKNCNKYYKCKNNQWDQKQCPTGMHWNMKHTICTSPAVGECNHAFHF